MPKFRKKPVEIEAFQNIPGARPPFWFPERDDKNRAFFEFGATIKIATLEGVMDASPGDWIIRGVKGEIYPCKPDIFAVTYDEVVTQIECPTIDELEKTLQEPDRRVSINPDGSVTAELKS